MKKIYKIGNQTFDIHEMDHILDLWQLYTDNITKNIIGGEWFGPKYVTYLNNHLKYHKDIEAKFKNAIEIIEVPE